jgi:two-component system nitrogen regulation sensor histidine kinase NtrY
MNGRPRARRRASWEQRMLWMALATGLPGGALALILLLAGDFAPRTRWTLMALLLCAWLGLAFSLRRRVVLPLQTIANLIGALREGDYSIRAAGSRRGDALGEVMLEVNALTAMMRDQRLDAMEANALLRAIMSRIDVAVFAFDAGRALRMVNRAGERLLSQPSERLLGRSAEELDLADCLAEEATGILDRAFPGAHGRWEARRSAFRQGGMPMQLLVLTDVSRALRQEEREAWRRLIRVMGHELNNSLTPIRSLADSLASLMARAPRPSDWEEDARRGLAVIASRAESLSRFMDAYGRLARLPPPRLAALDLGPLVRRVAGLETRVPVSLNPGPDITVRADGDQIEQLLINLVRNAADASLETGGAVTLTWARNGTSVDVVVRDEGPGLSSRANLFVPFFTTKPGGTGIGLVLCRQIAEAHGGTLDVSNRPDAPGCEARLRLAL